MCVFSSPQVALVAADFFSGSYLPALKAVLPATSGGGDASAAAASAMVRSAILLQHSPLLQPLVEALVLRTQVGGWGVHVWIPIWIRIFEFKWCSRSLRR